MPATLDALLAKGYKFVTVSELLAMDKPVPAKPKATPAPKTAANKPASDSAKQ
jgi:peptidoglycan-N-acetylglucosamine deacetylase